MEFILQIKIGIAAELKNLWRMTRYIHPVQYVISLVRQTFSLTETLSAVGKKKHVARFRLL